MGELGDRPRVTATTKRVLIYRCEWEHDGYSWWPSEWDSRAGLTDPGSLEPDRKTKVKTFRSRWRAYRWMAERLIFSKRDKLTTHDDPKTGYPRGCRLCEDMPTRYSRFDGTPMEPKQCRYHDEFSFDRLRKRLARWLLWRDKRRAELLEEKP